MATRLESLKAKLSASEKSASKIHYKTRIKALKVEIARLEGKPAPIEEDDDA